MIIIDFLLLFYSTQHCYNRENYFKFVTQILGALNVLKKYVLQFFLLKIYIYLYHDWVKWNYCIYLQL